MTQDISDAAFEAFKAHYGISVRSRYVLSPEWRTRLEGFAAAYKPTKICAACKRPDHFGDCAP